jgi:predicted RecA/RadA family phage recombinase
MAQAIYVQDDDVIDYTPSSAVAAGQVVVQNDIVGVAARPLAANELGALTVEGIFDVVKATGAINAGAKVYWNAAGDPVGGVAGSGAATATASNYTYMGRAALAAASGDATVRVVMENVVSPSVTVAQPITTAIADPGASGAIPVTDSGHVDIVTAAAETRTLAAPSSVGQLLLISMKTDGGDCVITCATTVNQTGNNTITLNDAGDAVLFVGKANGTNKRWSVVSNDGAALSTV